MSDLTYNFSTHLTFLLILLRRFFPCAMDIIPMQTWIENNHVILE